MLPPVDMDPAHWGATNLRYAIVAAGVALWSWNVDTDRLTMDERGFELWDLGPQGKITFEELSLKIHPSDRDRVRAAFAATRAVAGPYEVDFRILVGNNVRWVSARGKGEDVGIVDRIVFGIFLDVTGRKQAEEAHELLAGEMSHRVKNLLTVATSLTAISSRSAQSASEMASDLTARLTALGRAHDLVRPVPGDEGQDALFGDLISVVLAPYDGTGPFSGRIRVSVPRMGVGEGAATSLALILHELATNAVKYGSLAEQQGTLDVSCTADEETVVLIWTERGGVPLTEPAEQSGFGSKLMSRLSAQLGGSYDACWSEEGLVLTLTMTKARLAA
jgi:two-component sensor histidine kinase